MKELANNMRKLLKTTQEEDYINCPVEEHNRILQIIEDEISGIKIFKRKFGDLRSNEEIMGEDYALGILRKIVARINEYREVK
jgi:hypothetical protein